MWSLSKLLCVSIMRPHPSTYNGFTINALIDAYLVSTSLGSYIL